MGNDILILLSYIVEALILYFYMHDVFLPKRGLAEIILSITFLYEVQYMTSFLGLPVVDVILFALCNFAIIMFCYRTTPLIAFFHSAILTAFMAGTKVIVNLLFLDVLFKSDSDSSTYFSIKIICFVVASCFYLIFALISIGLNKTSIPPKRFETITPPEPSCSLGITPSHKLNRILKVYVARCESSNIAFYIDAQGADLEYISAFHMTTLFCNLLNNALLSVRNVPKPYIALTVRQTKTNHTVIKVKCPCTAKPSFDPFGNLVLGNVRMAYPSLNHFSVTRAIASYNGKVDYTYDSSDTTFNTTVTLNIRRYF